MSTRRTTGTVSIQAPLLEVVALGVKHVAAAASVVVPNRRIRATDLAFASWRSRGSTTYVVMAVCVNGSLTVTFSGADTGVVQFIVVRDVSQEPMGRGGKISGSHKFSRGVQADL